MILSQFYSFLVTICAEPNNGPEWVHVLVLRTYAYATFYDKGSYVKDFEMGGLFILDGGEANVNTSVF